MPPKIQIFAACYFDPISDICVGYMNQTTGEQFWYPAGADKSLLPGVYVLDESICPLGMSAEELKGYALKL
jgi:hypothetical protein